jgi:tetratricopeptide (TPR) repeat protein
LTDTRDDAAAGRRPSRPLSGGRDPVVRWLGYAAAILAVVVLMMLVYVLYTGLTPKTARTVVEQRMMTLEAATRDDPKNVRAWADYARVLTSAGRYAEARGVITRGREAVGAASAGLLIEEGRLEVGQARWEEAVKVLEQAAKLAEADRKKRQAEMAAKDVAAKAPAPELIEAQVLLGGAYAALKRWDSAIDSYTVALREQGNMADVLAERGKAYAATSKYSEARKDFEAALAFIPDYQPALDGLARLKAVGK